ncbi:MAG: Uma2 family endonuclease [Acidobacteriota bacterium]|nr:Uma2 family endonuclease [Acidobacteriota bacterium]
MAPQTSTRLTYEDYLELPDDGKQYELIEGELVLNPTPITRHQRIVFKIAMHLQLYFDQHGGGEAFIAPLDVVLADDVVLEPDVMVVLSERFSIIGEKNIQGAPNIVVEVLSESTRKWDETVKRKLYERFGVDEYWIVDPVIDVVKIHRRSGVSFVRAAEISTESGGEITSPLLPGFALDVNLVFEA